MLSDVLHGPQGSYLDLSTLFPEGVFAYVTLKGFENVAPETLREFLRGRGRDVLAVHRVDQVHSAMVVRADQSPCSADALVGSAAGEAVRVVTADCVPILLANADGSRYAAVHAGWKGTLARIVESAAAMVAGRDVSGITAYVGPAIGPCCYTVDGERLAAFDREFPGWLPQGGSAPTLDLQSINARMLERAGVPRDAIHVEERCTACSLGLCCSYRRDGERAGRMASLVGRTA